MLVRWYAQVFLAVVALRQRAAVSARRPLRAAGLLEYALIALMAIGIFGILYTVFNEQISGLLQDLTGRIDTNTQEQEFVPATPEGG